MYILLPIDTKDHNVAHAFTLISNVVDIVKFEAMMKSKTIEVEIRSQNFGIGILEVSSVVS